MFDERSFSSTSFDTRSWLFSTVTAVVNLIRRSTIFVMKKDSDVVLTAETNDLTVKKRVN